MMASRRRSTPTYLVILMVVGFMLFGSSLFLTIESRALLRAIVVVKEAPIAASSPEADTRKAPTSTASDNHSPLDSSNALATSAGTEVSDSIQETESKDKTSTNQTVKIITTGHISEETQDTEILKPSNDDKSIPAEEESVKKHQETNHDSNKKDEHSQNDSPKLSMNVTLKYEPQGVTRCGCPLCDEVSLQQSFKGLQCKRRVDFMMKKYQASEEKACLAAADPVRYPQNPCGQECNPETCKGMTEKPKPFKPDLSNITESHEPFTRHDGVAIVTKTYSLQDNGEKELKRMICLMNAAYNRHVNYDYVIFVAMPFSKSQEVELQNHAYPAKLTLVQEPSLEEHLANMTKDESDFLNKRCGVVDGENITWMHHCREEGSDHVSNLAYSWQAEFRAAHIYTHPALMDYKYMIWLDTDAWITKDWDKDPIQAMVENDLVILFDSFDYGATRGLQLKEKMEYAYNKSICSVSLNKEKGHLETNICEEDWIPNILQIGGFNHITNLDVYRKDIHQKFLLNMVGDYKFSRQWDDQLGVTVPALFESPERSWDTRANGFNFGIVHHYIIDAIDPMIGTNDYPVRNINKFWTLTVAPQWDAGKLMCDDLFDYLE